MNTYTQVVVRIRGLGSMINSMVKGLRNGPMDPNMKEITQVARSMVRVLLILGMAVVM